MPISDATDWKTALGVCSLPNFEIRTLRSARKFVLAVVRKPENAVASSSRVWALPPPHFRYPPSGISRLSGISVSSRATVLLPLRSRHSLTLMQYEIASE